MEGLNDLIWNPEDNDIITPDVMTVGCHIEIGCEPQNYMSDCVEPYFPMYCSGPSLPNMDAYLCGDAKLGIACK